MKKSQLIGIALLSTIFGSMIFAGFVSAIDPYFPDPEDVEGYDLLYENIVQVANPLDAAAASVTAGAQVWVKTDAASDITAVVGALIVKYSEDVFGKRIPRSFLSILYEYTAYDNIKTYWDLLVAIATEFDDVEDISGMITTTDGSIEFDTGAGSYLILSKDAEFLIFSFAFEISNDWTTFVDEHEVDVNDAFDVAITFAAGFLAIFQTIFMLMEGFDGTLPIPESSSNLGHLSTPTGTPTSAADVQFVTNQIGALYGSSNLLWIILGVVGGVIVVGGIILLVRRRRK